MGGGQGHEGGQCWQRFRSGAPWPSMAQPWLPMAQPQGPRHAWHVAPLELLALGPVAPPKLWLLALAPSMAMATRMMAVTTTTTTTDDGPGNMNTSDGNDHGKDEQGMTHLPPIHPSIQ